MKLERCSAAFFADVMGAGACSRVQLLVSCREFVERFLAYARGHYVRPDGTQTRQAVNFEIALRWWCSSEPVRDVGLEDLKAYRAHLVERGLTTRTVNQYVNWVKTAFRWGAEVGHLPASVPAEMGVLRPLRVRSKRRSHRSGSVRIEDLRRIAEYLDERGRAGAMLRVQWLSGARPGEVRRMAWEELLPVGRSWIYRPTRHKVEHHGIDRVLVLVPEAVRWLGRPDTGSVFKTRLGSGYSATGYLEVMTRACEALELPAVTPSRVRHAAATAARALGGAEAAQRLLGHTSTTMTEQYLDLGWMDTVSEVERMQRRGWSFEQ